MECYNSTMGKLAHPPSGNGAAVRKGKARRLIAERKALSQRLAKLNAKLAQLRPARRRTAHPTPAEIDGWFNALSDGLPNLPPLPVDFSRADLYDDHD